MTETRKLVLHVGLPKTGTSALQAWLRANRIALLDRGVDYPDVFPPGGDKHQFLVAALRGNNLEPVSKLLADATSRTVVLSTEGLTNHLYDFDVDALRAFRQMTSHMETTVVLVTREAEPWLNSFYKQSVLNPRNGASDLWGTALDREAFARHPRIRMLLDHSQLERDLAAGLGGRDVVRLRYEDDWFTGFLRLLGLESSDFPPLAAVNDSLPDWVVDLVYRINQVGLPEQARRRWRSALQEFLETNHSVMINSIDANWRSDAASMDPGVIDQAVASARSEEEADRLRAFAAFVASVSRRIDV